MSIDAQSAETDDPDDDEVITYWCGVKGAADELFDDALSSKPCGGFGYLDCLCGGDQCVCHHHGQEVECPGCEDCHFGDEGGDQNLRLEETGMNNDDLLIKLRNIEAYLYIHNMTVMARGALDASDRICKTEAFEALLAACENQTAWIERLLENLEHRIVYDSRNNPINSFSGAIIPDWDLRQKLESLRDDIAKAKAKGVAPATDEGEDTP